MAANADLYPELLADLAAVAGDLLVQRGLPVERAAEIGYELAEHLSQHWGGLVVYMPKGRAHKLSRRDFEIWTRFNGRNVEELAREYELTTVRIYQIVKAVGAAERSKRQPGLF